MILIAPILLLLDPEIAESRWSTIGLAMFGLAGAVFIWAEYARPRLVVDPDGLTVVDTLRVRRLAWQQIRGFDCQQCLIVKPVTGPWISVAALPAPGVRRVFVGARGPVDDLAIRLNQHLASRSDGMAGRQPPVSVDTAEGRRDIRMLALLTALAGIAVGIGKTLVALT